MKKKPESEKELRTKERKRSDSVGIRIKGLTIKEWLMYFSIKKKLARYGIKSSKKDTTQRTIAFEHIYPDGICKVSGDYYTAMIEFEDVNYTLLEESGKKRFLDEYEKIFCYFDPDTHAELFMFNRRTDGRELNSMLDIPLKNDRFDDIRKEYLKVIRTQASKGTNGIIKKRYVVIGIHSPKLAMARERLRSVCGDTVRNFFQVGSYAHILNAVERLKVLHDYFCQRDMRPFSFSFEKMNREGKCEKDYIAPDKMDFSSNDSFISGKMHGKAYYLEINASQLRDDLIRQILDIDDSLSISIHTDVMEQGASIKQIKGKLSDVQKKKVDSQKEAVRKGFDMDILPADIVVYESSLLSLLNEMNTTNLRLVNTSVIICCFGRTEKEFKFLSQRINGIIVQSGNALNPLMELQEQALMSAAPIGRNLIEKQRLVTSHNIANIVPFCTQELFMQGEAFYYGLNVLTDNLIMADRKQLRTPNGLILGTPGSGKSFSAKREILSCYLQTDDDVLICDPEGEYSPIVELLGGQTVRLATNSTEYLNPMDIQLSHWNDRDALKLKSDFLITLCDMIAGGTNGLENDEKGIIDECIRHIYDRYFSDPIPENMPVLGDLYQALLEHRNPRAERIANSLVLYVSGSQNYFNHRTNVDSNNRVMCFDIRELGTQLKPIGMLVVQDAVWNRVSLNRERNVATRYYCDEFHLLLKEKQTAKYSVEMWKRFRKWGGIPTGLTQNVTDFMSSEEIEGILSNSDFIYLLNQSDKDQGILAEKLRLTGPQLKYVTNSRQGSGLIIFNNVVIPFVDNYPQDTKTFKIMSTRPEDMAELKAQKNEAPLLIGGEAVYVG